MGQVAILAASGTPPVDGKAAGARVGSGLGGLFEAVMALELAKGSGASPAKKPGQPAADPMIWLMSVLMQGAAANQPIPDFPVTDTQSQPADTSQNAAKRMAGPPQLAGGVMAVLMQYLAQARQGDPALQPSTPAGHVPAGGTAGVSAAPIPDATSWQLLSGILQRDIDFSSLVQAAAQLPDPNAQVALDEIRDLFLSRLAGEPAAPSQAQTNFPIDQAAESPAIAHLQSAECRQGELANSLENNLEPGPNAADPLAPAHDPDSRKEPVSAFHEAMRAAHTDAAPAPREHEQIGPASVRPGADAFERVVQSIAGLKDSNGKEMRIHLKPEFLGKVVIRLTVEDGGLVARIAAANPKVQDAFLTQAASLQASLAEQGLKDVRVVVTSASVRDPGLQQQAEGRRSRDDSPQRRRGRGPVEAVGPHARALLAYAVPGKPGAIDYLA